MKNILIITYEWPPSAGIGVQRWLKLSKYLLRQNVTPIILTVDEKYANYHTGEDISLVNQIPRELIVYKTKSFEPFRAILKKIRIKSGKQGGFYSRETKSGLLKIIQLIRNNLLIPDAYKGWNNYAIKKATQILNKHNIKIVITTSPHHSTHLIGLRLKERFNIKWIADFRDPWTDSRWFSNAEHSRFSKSINKALEKKVLINADKIFTVGEGLKLLLLNKSNKISNSQICVIPNGFDKEDYEKKIILNSKVFNICYCGSMEDSYEPYVFFKTLKKVIDNINNIKININLVGYISKKIKRELIRTGLKIRFNAYVSHKESIAYQQNASLLLLVIPNTANANVIITGKLFEYLGTGNRIICIGPKTGDAAKIINNCNCGKTFERTDNHAIKKYITNSINDFINDKIMEPNKEVIESYSRELQAKALKSEFEKLLSK